MEAMRQSWSDDRLDDLSDRVEAGFVRVDERFARVEARMDEGFSRLDARIDATAAELRQEMKSGFDRVDRRFERLEQRFDRLLLTLTVVALGLVGSLLVAGLAG
jgi:hypothetical protein